MKLFVVMAAIGLVLVISFGGWYFSRYVNYKMSYQVMVKDTIKQMVKQDCLK